mmetsp:Transcript_2826/g.8450  ORF Transcript_2826/g.8450 Transcript_2826/m.8450 type:complete len:207 (-) Transcript_2826:98-718(-)
MLEGHSGPLRRLRALLRLLRDALLPAHDAHDDDHLQGGPPGEALFGRGPGRAAGLRPGRPRDDRRAGLRRPRVPGRAHDVQAPRGSNLPVSQPSQEGGCGFLAEPAGPGGEWRLHGPGGRADAQRERRPDAQRARRCTVRMQSCVQRPSQRWCAEGVTFERGLSYQVLFLLLSAIFEGGTRCKRIRARCEALFPARSVLWHSPLER